VIQTRLTSPATVAAVNEALEICRCSMVETPLREAARMTCDDARSAGLSVEQMLIAVKQDLETVMDCRHFPRCPQRSNITDQFITLCIDEFYRIDADATQRRDSLPGEQATSPPTDRRGSDYQSYQALDMDGQTASA
jgi:hypothetical protein